MRTICYLRRGLKLWNKPCSLMLIAITADYNISRAQMSPSDLDRCLLVLSTQVTLFISITSGDQTQNFGRH